MCDLFSAASLKKIYPELSFIVQNQDIREVYTITQAITFNTVTGLFYANEVNPPHTPIYLRFCRLSKEIVKVVAPRFQAVSRTQQNFAHLVPYVAFASTEFHFYLAILEEKNYVNIIDAIRNEKFVVTEQSLRDTFKTIIATLGRMHDLGIIHGQLNPSKVFIKNNEGYIFDLSMGVESCDDLIVENYHFLAPEILGGCAVSQEGDVWALGAVLYHLVASHSVYPGALFEDYVDAVATSEVNFDEPAWNLVSQQLKTLIKKMLAKDKGCRPTMKEVEESDWVRSSFSALTHTLIVDLSNFERYHEFRSCLYKVMSALANTKTREDVQEWNTILAQNYVEEIDFGTILSYLLGESHPLCEEFYNYWEVPVNHKRFLLAIMGLRSLMIQERAAILFYQLSKDGRWLEERDIVRLLENTGNAQYLKDKRRFRLLIKEHQENPIRANHYLSFTEFLAFHNRLGLNPSEEFAMGRFFDSTK